MNMGDLIVLGVLGLVAGAIGGNLWKNRKKGCCGSCDGCTRCQEPGCGKDLQKEEKNLW